MGLLQTESKIPSSEESETGQLPLYLEGIQICMEKALEKTNLKLWLMLDRLDELFQRRSPVETRALRALLRSMKVFESKHIKVKIFLRDDIFEQVTATSERFTALTHVTARSADKLRWTEDQLLYLIVQRFFANQTLRQYLNADANRIIQSPVY